MSVRDTLARAARASKHRFDFIPASDEIAKIAREHLNQQRRLLHFVPRVLTRTYIVLTPARRQYRLRRMLALWTASTALDAAYWHRLRDPKVDDWASRSITYGIDAAAWSRLGPRGHFDSAAALLLWPLAGEVVLNQNQRRTRHALSTLLTALPIIIDGRRRRTAVPIKSWRWPAVAIVAVGVVRGFARGHIASAEKELGPRLEQIQAAAGAAARSRARRNIVTGSSSARDWIVPRSGRLHDLGREDLVREFRELEEEKHRLAGTVADSDSPEGLRYLHEVLEGWSHAIELGAILVSDTWTSPMSMPLDYPPIVLPECSPEVGQIILTPPQVIELNRQLAALSRSTPTAVEAELGALIPPPAERPREVALKVDAVDRDDRASVGVSVSLRLSSDHTEAVILLALPRDEAMVREPLPPYDPVFIAFMLDTLWVINDLSWLPRKWSLPILSAAGSAAVGTSMLRRELRRLPTPPQRAVYWSIALQAISTLHADRSAPSSSKSDGSRQVPPIGRLELPLLVTSSRWGDLDTTQRRRALTIMSAIALLGTVRARGRWNALDALLQTLFTVQAAIPSYKIGTWSFAALEQRFSDYVRDERPRAERSLELDYAEKLLQRSENLYNQVVAVLGESDRDVEQFHATERRRLVDLRNELDALDRRDRPADGFEALMWLDESVSTVVLDIDNTLVRYGSDMDERVAMLERAVRVAESKHFIKRLVFATNGPIHLDPPASETIDVSYISAARKPWVQLQPLRRYRSELLGATVIGDQPLLDGLLANNIDGKFVHVQGFQTGRDEPPWPRLQRFVGKLLH